LPLLCSELITSIVCLCGCLTSIVVEPENYERWQVMKLSSLLQNMLSLHLLAELTSLLLPCACLCLPVGPPAGLMLHCCCVLIRLLTCC